MIERRPGQGAEERGLDGLSPGMLRHLPTVTRMVARTDPERRAFLDGARGEQKVAKVLRRICDKADGELVCDLMLDKENVDLIAVLPTGVFVVEVKHWHGKATLKDEVIFHGGPTPHRVHAQVLRQIKKLTTILELDVPMDGVIVLARNGDLRVRGKAAEGTTPVVMAEDLRRHLVGSHRRPRPHVLDPTQVADVAARLRAGAPALAIDRDPNDYRCARCGAPAVRRNSKRGPFLGCSTFPSCRGTSPRYGAPDSET